MDQRFLLQHFYTSKNVETSFASLKIVEKEIKINPLTHTHAHQPINYTIEYYEVFKNNKIFIYILKVCCCTLSQDILLNR